MQERCEVCGVQVGETRPTEESQISLNNLTFRADPRIPATPARLSDDVSFFEMMELLRFNSPWVSRGHAVALDAALAVLATREYRYLSTLASGVCTRSLGGAGSRKLGISNRFVRRVPRDLAAWELVS